MDFNLPRGKLSLATRFPTTHSFFRYHSLKVKRRFLDPEVRFDICDWKLYEAVDLEWTKLDLLAAAEFAELRYRLLRKNDESYLHSASAAHLFHRDGTARIIGREGFGVRKRHLLDDETCRSRATGLKHQGQPQSNESDGYSDGPLEPLPRMPALYRPLKNKLRSVRKPHRTLFVRLPSSCSLKPFQIASACSQLLPPQIKERTIVEDAEILPGRNVCILRFRHKDIARKLVHRFLWLDGEEMRLQSYPIQKHRVFLAEASDLYDLCPNSLRANVAYATPNMPFRLRKNAVEDEERSFFLVTFERVVESLYFDVGVRTRDGSTTRLAFYPVAGGRCRICNESHDVRSCFGWETVVVDGEGD